MGYKQLYKSLEAKWSPKGDFALINFGYDYYLPRFSNMDDYDHIMISRPWLIKNKYLIIQKWVPNFVSRRSLDGILQLGFPS